MLATSNFVDGKPQLITACFQQGTTYTTVYSFIKKYLGTAGYYGCFGTYNKNYMLNYINVAATTVTFYKYDGTNRLRVTSGESATLAGPLEIGFLVPEE